MGWSSLYYFIPQTAEQMSVVTKIKIPENRLYANACADNASVCVHGMPKKSCRIVVAINQKVN